MFRKISSVFISFIFIIFNLAAFYPPAFAASPIVEYLCSFGIEFYQQARYDEALAEFNKALIVEPDNKTAKEYIAIIFQKDFPRTQRSYAAAKDTFDLASPQEEPKAPPTETSEVKPVELKAEPVVNAVEKDTLNPLLSQEEPKASPTETPEAKPVALKAEPAMPKQPDEYAKVREKQADESNLHIAGLDVTGEVQLRLGIDSEDVIWKKAHWDLNEKKYRMLEGTGLSRFKNTYDPRIFDRLKVNLDTNNAEGLNFHSNITMDPWTFIGKTDKIRLTTTGVAPVDIQLKYWSNARYTLGAIGYTFNSGDTYYLPEIKVINGRTSPVLVDTNWSGDFTIPAMDINRQVQPVREFWFDYNKDALKLRVFPFAYGDQALTFDDPLKLSNNAIWWEESPWLRKWTPGRVNVPPWADDFTKGYWDNEISFNVRDSDGRRLTSLRGITLDFAPTEQTSFAAAIATPKDPWQDYSDADNIISAARLKHYALENLRLGFSATSRTGFKPDDEHKLDAVNYVLGTDLSLEVTPGLMVNAEIAHSQSEYDISDDYYKSSDDGYAYHFSLVGRFPFTEIINTEYGYDGIQPDNESFFTKFRFFTARMDRSFNQPLSSYVETRKDEFWSRHLHFRQPFQRYLQGSESLSWDDVKNFAIGNGLDSGRQVIGLRLESCLWDKRVDNLFDIRNVHSTKGDFIENVARDEITWRVNDKLTAKFLGIYQAMPKTTAGIDPFVYNRNTGRNYLNDQVEGGKDSSVATGSLGLQYAFFDWVSLYGIWEYTNDYYLGYDGFPRSILDYRSNSYLYTKNGRSYREMLNGFWGQEYFPNPPYDFYNIFKAGLIMNPTEKLQIFLDYTRNEYAKAGQTDDNLNHVGIEFAYSLTDKIGLFFKYTYSRWQDLEKLIQGITKKFGHHNFFAELMYRKSEDEDLVLQYGEAGRNPMGGVITTLSWDPYGGSLNTLDTQHIVRLYYRRRF